MHFPPKVISDFFVKAVHILLMIVGRAVEIPCSTCPTWSLFIQDKLKISIYLTSTNVLSYTTLYFIFRLFITSSHLALKTVWILLQKPADLDLHFLQEKPADQDPYCLQELIYIWFHTVFEKKCLSTVR